MRKNKFVFSVFFVFLNVFFGNISFAVQSKSPVQLLQYVADHMIAGLKANKATLKTKPGIVYHLAYQYVVPYADLTEMSKRVLPPRTWNSATEEQRKAFEKAFTKTVIRTYASALTSYQDQTIQFYPTRAQVQNSKWVEVNSEISSSQSQTIHVTYRLIRNQSGWRLYDMAVEGVDMLESYRAQFEDILAQGDITTLLQKLSNHNNRK